MTTSSVREMYIYLREAIPRLENLIEAISAKIIKDISDEIRKCECTKKLLAEPNNQITLGKGKQVATGSGTSGLQKFSYPNYSVGNEELVSSKNPHSLVWPFGLDK